MIGKMVDAFHRKHGFPIDATIKKYPWTSLGALSKILRSWADGIKLTALNQQEAVESDPRLYRAHLMCEELGEVMEALDRGDEIALADGLADLAYVVFGTAVTFGIPLDEVVEEVHRSNMTKKLRTSDNLRMRDKGSEYVPPDIAEAIRRGRGMTDWATRIRREMGQ